MYRLYKKINRNFETEQDKNKRERKNAEYLLISPTNCGRTWLRVMLGKALKEEFKIQNVNLHYLYSFSEINPNIPSIKASHERYQQFGDYQNYKVILLVRDPRDAMVSRYMQRKGDNPELPQNISQYIMENSGLQRDYIQLYNRWIIGKENAKAFLLVRYEDLRRNTGEELSRILQFLGLSISVEIIDQAVTYASLENMKKIERLGSNEVRAGVFRTTTNLDANSYKVRKGEVGGYRNYLSSEALTFVDDLIRKELDPSYGYSP